MPFVFSLPKLITFDNFSRNQRSMKTSLSEREDLATKAKEVLVDFTCNDFRKDAGGRRFSFHHGPSISCFHTLRF